ncbi:unnamed protein product [Closterium sp. Naga37s-1]|nr:unnamed protein product [Closterium sp. Naga37s-1]
MSGPCANDLVRGVPHINHLLVNSQPAAYRHRNPPAVPPLATSLCASPPVFSPAAPPPIPMRAPSAVPGARAGGQAERGVKVHDVPQFKVRVRLSRLSEEQRRAAWEEQHERGAEELHSLCTEMQGFFLKLLETVPQSDPSPSLPHGAGGRLHPSPLTWSDNNPSLKQYVLSSSSPLVCPKPHNWDMDVAAQQQVQAVLPATPPLWHMEPLKRRSQAHEECLTWEEM